MELDPKKHADFQRELEELLEKYNFTLVIAPIFTDKLGHKHPLELGTNISAELQVKVKENGTEPGN